MRLELGDAARTALYVDPLRAHVVRHTTRAKRLERWLYNGLHSWDFAFLYRHPAVWRSVVIASMVAGVALTLLGFARVATRRRGR